MSETAPPNDVFQSSGMSQHILTPDEAEQVRHLSERASRENGDPNDDDTLGALAALAGDLPLSLRAFLHRERLTESPSGVTVLSNLTVAENVGPTPRSWRGADTQESRPDAFTALLLGSLLGDPIGWSAQQSGRVVTDVLPSPGMEQSDISASSARELSWHTEDAFSPYRADWVGLLCLRNPHAVATTVSRLAVGELPEPAERVLREPRFVLDADPAHELDDGPEPDSGPVALLAGAPDAPTLRADRDYMRAVADDDEAAQALKQLIHHLDDRLTDVVLGPGDMAFIDNNVFVHGRRSFQATYSPAERWLKRINVVRDIRRTRPGRISGSSRVLRSL
ncbi:TauD/TfdA family dioxygenase [Streptomyces sp. NPDC056161]|uniref:TauD/TfdA family dioxygenase n=1 Tax=Streptomyces sp. NPDC056161 TaxID=3345732 RepID=UPI0035E3B647